MAATPPDAAPAQAKLNLWDTTSLIIGIIIGAGIFRTPGEVFASVNGPWQAIGLWVMGGLISLLGALCFAELASTFPRSGGEYVYLTRAFGRPFGFLFAWDQITLIRSAGSTGIIAFAFGEYTSRLLDIRENVLLYNAAFAVSAIALFTFINMLGVYTAKWIQNLLTALKVVSITGLVVVGTIAALGLNTATPPVVYHGTVTAAKPDQLALQQRDGTVILVKLTEESKIWINGSLEDDDGNTYRVSDLKQGQEVRVVALPQTPDVAESVKTNTRPFLLMLGVGLVAVLWAYAGWHEAAYVVAEVRQERRTIPLALLSGTSGVTIIYVAVAIACLAALGFERASESREIAADVLGVLGSGGEKVMAVLVMISCLGATHGTTFTSARIFAEVGRDHALFSPLARWSARWGTPVNALLVNGGVSIAMVVFVCLAFPGKSPFLSLLFCTAAAFWVFFLMTGISLFVLRHKDRDLPRPFRVPLYPVVPLLFCLACFWMLYSSINDFPKHSLVGLGIVLLGVPLYLVSEALRRKRVTQLTTEPLETGITVPQTGITSPKTGITAPDTGITTTERKNEPDDRLRPD